MFKDLAEIAAFASTLLHSRGSRVPDGRQLYALFLALERAIDDAKVIAAVLHPGVDDISGTTTTTQPRYMKIGNELFKDLDQSAKALVESVSQLVAYGSSKILLSDQDIERAFAHHFHPKSHWYIHFLGMYNSGRISEDGTSIERTIFHLHTTPSRRILGFEMDQNGLCACEILDCSTAAGRADIAEQCKSPLQTLGKAYDAIAQLLRTRCTLDDLLVRRRLAG